MFELGVDVAVYCVGISFRFGMAKPSWVLRYEITTSGSRVGAPATVGHQASW
jgi:hypothetical protein